MSPSAGQDKGMEIEERSYRRPDLPRLVEQQDGHAPWHLGSDRDRHRRLEL